MEEVVPSMEVVGSIVASSRNITQEVAATTTKCHEAFISTKFPNM
jgi:hypothetical protein